jgi:acetate kinase
MSTAKTILAINSGSSSLKFALYRVSARSETLLVRGAVEGIGLSRGRLWLEDASGKIVSDARCRLETHREAIRRFLAELERSEHPPFDAVGHRLVNGGPNHWRPQRITPKLIRTLHATIPLAPLHLPTELKIISAMTAKRPGTPQVACFDTAFHRRMPELAQRLPLPRAFWNEGLRRYGFHGLSYEYIVGKLGPAAKMQRVIIAHLGSGASLAAVHGDHSIETTMGFTPTSGVIMGTRSGDLEPGVPLYLIRERRYDAARLERLVDCESGLLGISGTTSDMKTLLRTRRRDPRAREAVAMFCYSVRKQIGALSAVLGGLDMLVFTGGIGERAAAVRAEICRGLAHLGVRVAGDRNRAHAEWISAPRSACSVRVLATNEELMIARHTRAALRR